MLYFISLFLSTLLAPVKTTSNKSKAKSPPKTEKKEDETRPEAPEPALFLKGKLCTKILGI